MRKTPVIEANIREACSSLNNWSFLLVGACPCRVLAGGRNPSGIILRTKFLTSPLREFLGWGVGI